MEQRVLPQVTPSLDCGELLELVPEYCLGTASAAEVAQIEANLDRCLDLRPEIDAYRAVTDQLLHTSPRQSAPSNLKAGVLAKIHAAPMTPVTSIAPNIAALPRRNWRLRPLTGLVAALVMLLIGTNLFWALRSNEKDEPTDAIPVLTEFNSAGSLTWFQLVGRDSEQAAAWCIWSKTTGQGVLVAENFPQLPEGQSYQVWMNRDSQVVSMGVLEVSDDGKGVLVLPDFSFKGKVASVNVTYEPAGGSQMPTGRAVVWSEFNRQNEQRQ